MPKSTDLCICHSDRAIYLLIESNAKTAQWVGDQFDNKLAGNHGISDFLFTDTALAQRGESLGLRSHYLPLATTSIRVSRQRLTLADVRKLYLQHKFVLNTINSSNITNGLPSRCFDVTGHGACLVTDDVADLHLNLVPNKECLVIPGGGGGQAIAELLTRAQDTAQSIAHAGQSRTLREHTWSNRWDSIRRLNLI